MTSAVPSPKRVQIYGERCSGTNWIAQLLRRNLPGVRVVDDFGWKHGLPQGDIEHALDCIFVVVHRDPFDWLRSLHGMPWHAGPELRDVPFSRFLRTPWRCVWGTDMDLAKGDARVGSEMVHERDLATGKPFANVMQLRRGKMQAWAALPTRVRHHLDVRYEAVVPDPRTFVRTFAARFGLRRWPWFRGVTTAKGGRERFLAKPYAPIAADDLAWITSQLDVAAERALGFDLAARRAQLAGQLRAAMPLPHATAEDSPSQAADQGP